MLVLVMAVPTGLATPLACQGTCLVEGHSLGFRPPVVEIEDGSRIVWLGVDTSHINQDFDVTGQPAVACFSVDYNPFDDSPAVQFDLTGSGVDATTNPGLPSADTRTCDTAMDVGAGSWAIPYVCVLHPALMRGLVVVSPA